MLDIDHFKQVNDTFGHDAGDKVLRAFSAMVVSEFRSVERVGRLGGEEFAVIFPKKTVKAAKPSCERLLNAVRSAITLVNGNQIGVTVSIGIAGMTPDKLEGTAILKRADELLYDAKTSGRDRIVVEPALARGKSHTKSPVVNTNPPASASQPPHGR